MPSKRPKKRVNVAVAPRATPASGSAGDMVPLEKIHQPPPPLLQQPIHYQYQQQQQPYQQQYQPPQQSFYMPLPTDHEVLDDFCAYLENRVLTKNMALLRRMLTEFLARQEHTLTQFKCFGANLIAVLPFDVLDQTKRRHADLLLQKKKHALVDQTCVFEFLFTRVATKNLAMLQQMFAEFRSHMEGSINEFVKLGVAAVSIVPYDPPHIPVERFAYNPVYVQPPPPPPPAYPPNPYDTPPVSQQQQLYVPQHYAPQQTYQHQQYQPPQHAYYQQQQQYVQLYQQQQQQEQQHYYAEQQEQHQSNAVGVPGVTPTHDPTKKIPTGHRKSHPSQDLSARSPIGSNATSGSNNNNRTSNTSPPAAGKRVVKKPVRYYKEQEEDELVAAAAKSSKRSKKELLAAFESGPTPSKARKVREANAKPKTTTKKQNASSNNDSSNDKMMLMDLDFSESEDDDADWREMKPLYQQLNKTNGDNSKCTIDNMIDETLRQFEEHAEAEAKAEKRKLKLKHRKMERQRAKEDNEARLRQQGAVSLQARSNGQGASASTANGSAGPTRVTDSALQLKTVVRDKLHTFEARQPWKEVFCGLPLPFDEYKAPKIADQLRVFWKLHARAVWERNFWMPLAQDGDSKENVARKARQRLACIMFDAIICDVFKAFGTEFFLRLDEQRHPGWWYRGPILDILAYHRVVGDSKCWEFVESQLCERFPDCGLELPLKSPNYGVLRRHICESAAMWSNAPKTALILGKIVELKKRRARARLVGGDSATSNGDNVSDSTSPSPIDPEASVEEEKEEEADNREAADVVGVDNGAETEAKGFETGAGPAGVGEAGAGDIDDDDDDHGEDMILPLDIDTDAAGDEDGGDGDDDDDEDADDEEEELLIEKIALASSFETDDTLQMTTTPATAKTTSVGSPVDACAVAEGVVATTTGGAIAAEEENGSKSADREIAARASAGTAAAVNIASDKDAGVAVDALARELEPVHFVEFIRKINPFGGE